MFFLNIFEKYDKPAHWAQEPFAIELEIPVITDIIRETIHKSSRAIPPVAYRGT